MRPDDGSEPHGDSEGQRGWWEEGRMTMFGSLFRYLLPVIFCMCPLPFFLTSEVGTKMPTTEGNCENRRDDFVNYKVLGPY